MLIALLVVLGVDLAVIVVLVSTIGGRRRWLARQPGVFVGAVRVSTGDIDLLKAKWHRGSGRWVRDVFVWSRAPFLLRSVLVPVDGVVGERLATPGEVKRLGAAPVVYELLAGEATIEVAARQEDAGAGQGAFRT